MALDAIACPLGYSEAKSIHRGKSMSKCRICFPQWGQVLLRANENETGDKRGGNGELLWALSEGPRSNIRKGYIPVGAWRATETSKPKGQHERHSLILHRPTTKPPTSGPGEPRCLAPRCRVHLRLPGLFFGMMRSP